MSNSEALRPSLGDVYPEFVVPERRLNSASSPYWIPELMGFSHNDVAYKEPCFVHVAATDGYSYKRFRPDHKADLPPDDSPLWLATSPGYDPDYEVYAWQEVPELTGGRRTTKHTGFLYGFPTIRVNYGEAHKVDIPAVELYQQYDDMYAEQLAIPLGRIATLAIDQEVVTTFRSAQFECGGRERIRVPLFQIVETNGQPLPVYFGRATDEEIASILARLIDEMPPRVIYQRTV